MEEHVDAPAPKQAAPSGTPPPSQPPVDPPPDHPAATPEQGKEPDKISKSDKIMLICTAFIALGTLVSAGAICFQWREMVSGGKDTSALVGYAQRQAEDADKMKESADKNAKASRDFADTAGLINKGIGDAVTKLDSQAKATQQAANAAKNAVDTAKESLHVSQRAYLIMGSLVLNLDTDVVSIPIINVGHIPSGQVTVIAYEATLAASSDEPAMKRDPVEAKSVGFSTFSIDPNPGAERAMNIPVPKVIPADFMGNKQQVVIAGRMNYYDGFQDDPLQTEVFCFAGLYFSSLKKVSWAFCDPARYIKEISEAEAKAAQNPN